MHSSEKPAHKSKKFLMYAGVFILNGVTILTAIAMKYEHLAEFVQYFTITIVGAAAYAGIQGFVDTKFTPK